MLHVIYTRFLPGHLSVRVGDGSRRSEEIVNNLELFAPLNEIIIIIKSQQVVLRVLLSDPVSVNVSPPRWPSGKASASRAKDPGFESRLLREFFGVESYQ